MPTWPRLTIALVTCLAACSAGGSSDDELGESSSAASETAASETAASETAASSDDATDTTGAVLLTVSGDAFAFTLPGTPYGLIDGATISILEQPGAVVQTDAMGHYVLPAVPAGGPSEAQWAALRNCESSGNYRAVSSSGKYRGAYQFDYRTWAGLGGTGDPAAAPPAEQDARAKLLYSQRGWRPWPVCGRFLR